MEVRSVHAVFEDGVLRPSEDLGLQEHERVRLIVTSEAEWQRTLLLCWRQFRVRQVASQRMKSRPISRPQPKKISPIPCNETRRDRHERLGFLSELEKEEV